MSNLLKIDRLLKKQPGASQKPEMEGLLNYAGYVAEIENVIAVVSDLKKGISRIFPGRFGEFLGIGNYIKENSIWEKAILDLMSENCVFSIFCAIPRGINGLIIIWFQDCV